MGSWTDSAGKKHHDMGTCHCGAHHAFDGINALRAERDAALAQGKRDLPPGWPPIDDLGIYEHSPVDTYRCENEDCPEQLSVWQFRPDDYDLDETAVQCPACGAEGELIHRWFRWPNHVVVAPEASQ